jgi:hypothetical protein
MTRSRRWWLAAAVAALVVGLPLVARALPARTSDVDAADLVALMHAAENHPFSGQVELAGNLDLPVTSRFTDVGALLGERTSLRVWWRGSDAWRVDKMLVGGETDLVHDGALTTEWSYESNRVVQSIDPDVRLPRTADLLPPALAARVLGDAERRAAVRIAARRVAGIGAPGCGSGRRTRARASTTSTSGQTRPPVSCSAWTRTQRVRRRRRSAPPSPSSRLARPTGRGRSSWRPGV